MTRETSKDPIITLSGFVEAETGKAILFEVRKVGEEFLADPKKEWFPFSQTKRIVKQPKDSEELDVLVVSEWICKQKGLI